MAKEEEGDRGWDGWMAPSIQWTGTWANSERWWETGRPGVLHSMGSQRVWHDLVTEQQYKNYMPERESQTGALRSGRHASNTPRWMVWFMDGEERGGVCMIKTQGAVDVAILGSDTVVQRHGKGIWVWTPWRVAGERGEVNTGICTRGRWCLIAQKEVRK